MYGATQEYISPKRRRALLQQKADLTNEGEAILAASENADRRLTANERKRLKGFNAELAEINADLEVVEQQAEHERSMLALRTFKPDSAGGYTESSPRSTPDGAPRMLGYDASGNAIPLLRPQDSFAELAPRTHAPGGNADPTETLGNVVRGMAIGEWGGAEKYAAQHGGGSLTGGGVLLDYPISPRIIDLARANAAVVKAGAITVPMTDRELTIARVTGNPSAQWRAENNSLTAGEITFAGVKLSARTLGVITKSSVELVEDARNLGALIENTLGEVLGLELDRAALRGIGSAQEPLGIENTAGVGTITSVGVPLDYAPFANAVEDIWTVNGEPGALIMSPRDAGTVDRLTDVMLQPLTPPKSYADLMKFRTSQLPTTLGAGADESIAIVGAFENLWIGMRTQIRIEVSRTAADSTNSAFTDMQVWVRGYLRADVAVTRADHFVVLSGIKPELV